MTYVKHLITPNDQNESPLDNWPLVFLVSEGEEKHYIVTNQIPASVVSSMDSLFSENLTPFLVNTYNEQHPDNKVQHIIPPNGALPWGQPHPLPILVNGLRRIAYCGEDTKGNHHYIGAATPIPDFATFAVTAINAMLGPPS